MEPLRSLPLHLVFAAFLLLFTRDASASTVLLDFESLPDGSAPTSGMSIGSTYQDLGVVFGSLEMDDIKGPVIVNRSIPENPVFWATDVARGPSGEIGFHIAATFLTPVTSVSFDTLGPFTAATTILATAFDPAGGLLGSVESVPKSGQLKGRYSLQGLGPIGSVLWRTSDPFVATVSIDNLEFRVVPEPSTALVLGCGLALLAKMRLQPAA